MKNRILVISSIFITSFASAQFTTSNAPQIGDSIKLFIVDSSAVNMEAVTGVGVTWDYSNLIDYSGETRLIDVKSPANTNHNITFSSSDMAVETEGELITFVDNDATERTSHGVVYKDATNGDLVLSLDTDPGLYYTYPFDLGSSIIDDISGTASFDFLGQSFSAPATGKVYTSVDGKGTLKLGLTGVYTDVLRYKIVDTIKINTPIGEYTALHKQFEYYDFTVSNLPVFVHSYLKFGPTNGVPRNEFTFVLSKDIITSSVSKESLQETKMYPNPTNGSVNFILPSEINSADISIHDAIGRVVHFVEMDQNMKSIDFSHLKKGTYFVKISVDRAVVTKTLILN